MSYFHGDVKEFIDSTKNESLFVQLSQVSGQNINSPEYRSWKQSLPEIANILDELLQNKKISDQLYVFIEYNLDFVSLRADVILVGKDAQGTNTIVVIELKQWSDLEVSDIAHHIRYRFLEQAPVDNVHPTLQAFEYRNVLKDYVIPSGVKVNCIGCSFLHNVTTEKSYQILSSLKLTSEFSFSKYNLQELKDFLTFKMTNAPDESIVNSLIHKNIRPAKSIIDEMESFITSQQDITLIGKQREIFLKIFDAVRKKKNKIFIISGYPGSGKTVLGVYLLKMLLNQNFDARLLLASKFLNTVVQAQFNHRMPILHPYTLIKNSPSWRPDFQKPENPIDCLICDETHRLEVQRSNIEKMLDVEVIMTQAKVSVFFIDPFQTVSASGTEIRDIEEFAHHHQIGIEYMKLDQQIRSGGSNTYQEWITHVFTKPISHVPRYDDQDKFLVQICDTPFEMEEKLQKHIDANKTAKILAGYTWDWSVPKQDGSLVKDIRIDVEGIGVWEKAWNRMPSESIDKTKRKSPAEHEYTQWYRDKTLNEVGCIYSSQGVEFDYVGVILGADIKKNFAQNSLNSNATVEDRTLLGTVSGHNKDKRRPNILNIYRTLMTRGKKGIYIYATDPEVREYFRSII